jgi:hypothetical protein
VLLAMLTDPAVNRPGLRLAAVNLMLQNHWHSPALTEALFDALPFDSQQWNWPVARALADVATSTPALLPANRLPFRRTLLQEPDLMVTIKDDFLWQRLIWTLCGGLDAEGAFTAQAIFLEPMQAPLFLSSLRAREKAEVLASSLQLVWTAETSTPEQATDAFLGLLALGETVEGLLTSPTARPSHVALVQERLARMVALAARGRDPASVERVAAALIPLNVAYPDLLAQALAAAAQIAWDYARARALSGLAPHLPPDLRDAALAQALAAAAQIASDYDRARALSGLAPHLPPDLRDAALAQALAAAAQIARDYARASALSGLAPHLPPDLRDAALAQALAAAAQIASDDARARALSGLAPHLPPDLRDAALAQALAAAAQIARDDDRASALTDLAPHVVKHPHLWRPLWAQTHADLLRAAPSNAARRMLERLAPAFPWDWLADPDRRAGAVADIALHGATNGLPLSLAAAQALDGLLNAQNSELLLPLLPLLRWPEKQPGEAQPDRGALPLVQAWRGHGHTRIAAHAALLLAEVGELDAAALPALVSLLASADDRSRYRVALALHARSSDNRFPTSKLGRETVEALVHLHDQHQADPRVGTVLYWTLTNVLHDDPTLLNAWAETLLAGGEGAGTAETVLSWVHNVTTEAWSFFQDRLIQDAARLHKALLNSIYNLLQQGQVPKDTQQALHTALHRLLAAQDRDVRRGALRCLGQMPTPHVDDYPAMQEVLLAVPALASVAAHALADLAQRDSVQQRDAIAAWLATQAKTAVGSEAALVLAGSWVRLHVRSDQRAPAHFPSEPLLDSLADLVGEEPERLIDTLWRAGADEIVWADYHERLVHAAQVLLNQRTSLVTWLAGRLETTLAGAEWAERRMALAFTAAAAEAASGAFAKRTDPDRLETLLIRAVDDANSFNVRRFSLTALGHLRRVSPGVVTALRRALRDVSRVQQDALAAVTHFRRIEGDLTPALAAGLADESAAAAFAVARGLEALARTESTTPAQRQAILTALADAIRNPTTQREVYVLEGNTIKHLGRLDQLLHQMLVRLAEGVRT